MCIKHITLEHKTSRIVTGNFEVALKEVVRLFPDDHISVKEYNGNQYTFDVYNII